MLKTPYKNSKLLFEFPLVSIRFVIKDLTMTPQQYKRMIDEQNRKIKQHNEKVQRDYDNYNREVKRHNDNLVLQQNREIKKINDFNKKQVDNYNRQVRQYNTAQHNQRSQLRNAINKFNQSRNSYENTRTSIIYANSVQNLESNYEILDDFNQTNNVVDDALLIYYPTQETSNSVQLYNSINGIDQGEELNPLDLNRSIVEDKLFELSSELGKRWKGALYSLNPQNPDAARHFCTSIREVFIQLIEIKAPTHEVLIQNPNCALHNGQPTRKEKIKYALARGGNLSQQLVSFVDADVDDLLILFRTLNDGTHGSAGTFSVQQLLKLKKRAEDSIIFITSFG